MLLEFDTNNDRLAFQPYEAAAMMPEGLHTLVVRLTCAFVVTLAVFTRSALVPVAAAPPERFWLAGQFDGNRVIVYFEAVTFGATFPQNARVLPSPVVFGFFSPAELAASYVMQLRKEFNFEPFGIGDRYQLLVGGGTPRPITLTTLVGFQSDEAVGNESLIGALATVEGSAPLLLTRGYYAVRRAESGGTPRAARATRTTPAGLSDAPVRFDVQTRLARLLDQQMQRDAPESQRQALGATPIAFAIQSFYLADGSLRYYVRSEWRKGRAGTDRAAYSLAAWIAPSPLRLLAVEHATSGDVYGFQSALPNLVNVVDLGRGRTGVIVQTAGLDSTGLALHEYRDAASLDQMPVLHAISVGE